MTSLLTRFRGAKPLKLDRYLIGEVLAPFVGATVFLCFVFLMFQALRLAEFFIIHGVSLWGLIQIASLMMMTFLPYVLPVAFLIAVLGAFGRLSADSELVALKANGISIVRMSVPILLLGAGVGLLSLELNQEWVPWSERSYRELILKIGKTKAISSVKEGAFTKNFFNLLIYADKVDPKTSKMRRVFIFDERDKSSPVTVVAQEGEILPVRLSADTELGMALKLRKGNIHSGNIEQNLHSKIDFNEYRLYLPLPEATEGGVGFRPRLVPQAELKLAIEKAEKNSGRWRELVTEYWRRIATALVPLGFVFFGIGFGAVRTRVVRVGASWVGLAVVLVYWVVQSWMLNLGYSGALPGWLAMLLPDLLIAAIAVPAFRSAMW